MEISGISPIKLNVPSQLRQAEQVQNPRSMEAQRGSSLKQAEVEAGIRQGAANQTI